MATTTQPHAPVTAEGHAAHGRELQHHFQTPAQQKDAASLGMWVFLVTEVMLFGGIFLAYTIYRIAFPDVWAQSAEHLNTPLGAVNTVVLLVSSLTVALAVNAAEEGRRTRLIQLLLVTILLGFGFLGIKAYEYSEKFAHCGGFANPIAWVTGGERLGETECLVPGRGFIFPAEHAAAAAGEAAGTEGVQQAEATGHAQEAVVGGAKTPYQLFYLLYFIATGLHAFHMIVGITIVSILTFLAWRGTFSAVYFTPVEIGGLYWHLIDIIWVFLFPLFYLVH